MFVTERKKSQKIIVFNKSINSKNNDCIRQRKNVIVNYYYFEENEVRYETF